MGRWCPEREWGHTNQEPCALPEARSEAVLVNDLTQSSITYTEKPSVSGRARARVWKLPCPTLRKLCPTPEANCTGC